MRIIMLMPLALVVTGCHPEQRKAQAIVKHELGAPSYADFRRIRTKPQRPDMVCGEVDASDHPGGGWRPFVAYISLNKAVVAPPGGLSAEDEGGNPLLRGAAESFNHACDD